MRRAPLPTTTGWQEWVCDYRVDAAAEVGGGQAWVQVCKGEGKMEVESEGEDEEKPDGEARRDGEPREVGAELGVFVPWEEGA